MKREVGPKFQPVEAAIQQNFLLAVFGRPMEELTAKQRLFESSICHGGLSLPKLATATNGKYRSLASNSTMLVRSLRLNEELQPADHQVQTANRKRSQRKTKKEHEEAYFKALIAKVEPTD